VSGDARRREVPPDAEAALARIAATEPAEESARLLANTVNRGVAALHRLARDQAAARKGTPSWSAWAKLANAARSALLAASMSREVANTLAASRSEEVPE
jgi:hypothetical protein